MMYNGGFWSSLVMWDRPGTWRWLKGSGMQPALMDMNQILLIAVILMLAVILSYFARRAIGRYWLHSSRRMNVHPSNIGY